MLDGLVWLWFAWDRLWDMGLGALLTEMVLRPSELELLQLTIGMESRKVFVKLATL